MRQLVAAFLFAGVGLAQQPSEDAVKKDLKQFQGTWTAVAVQDYSGRALPDAEVNKVTLVVDGNKFTLKGVANTITGTFKIDPTKKIKTIDVFLGKDTVSPIRGIYEISGDTRKSCFAQPDKDRPDSFRKEGGFIILEWKKAK
jgi:uncharacterized protein (TIGR03067 family)